jgi:hypothetical protein
MNIKNTTRELLPKLTKGKGMPVTGMMPMVMPDIHEHLE